MCWHVGLLLASKSVKDVQIFVGIILHFLDQFFAMFSKFVFEQWPPQAGLSISLVYNFFLLFSKLYICTSSFPSFGCLDEEKCHLD